MFVQLFAFFMIFFAAIGFARGFLKEVLGLLGIVLLFYITFHFGDEVANLFFSGRGAVAKVGFNIFFFLVVFIFISVLNKMVSSSLKNLNFNLFLDHFCGIMVGAIKGFSLALLLTIPLIAGGEAVKENSEKYELKLPEYILIDDESLFLHGVSALQHKLLGMAELDIDSSINNIFRAIFTLKKDVKENEKEDKKNKIAKGAKMMKTSF